MRRLLWLAAGAAVIAIMVWQAIVAHGNPDPARTGLSPATMVLSSGVLVFREGLEAILVLAAVTAGMMRTRRRELVRAVPVGAAAAFGATAATWFAMAAIVARIHIPALDLQAATGLVAIVVLLLVMNWFFHKVYWTGWIANHSNRRKRILADETRSRARVLFGLALLGFTAIYREGFEVVLFLQNLRLRAGDALVLQGMALGLSLTMVVGALTFVGHQRLPYKRMLVITGALLLVVLLVMVGEEAQEMQQAGWLRTTELHLSIPPWLGVWLSVFPTVQTLAAQAGTVVLVAGSYALANYLHLRRPQPASQ